VQTLGAGAIDEALGFAGTRGDALAIWEGAARRWPEVARRPTAGDIAAYRRLAGSRLAGRVLLLGVTPELRDLIATAGGAPVVLDMSAGMHRATSAMLRHANPSRETWIEADWCEADLPVGEFDLALGDQIWWAVSIAKQRELRDTIRSVLHGEGLFVGRFRFSEPGRAQRDPIAQVSAFLERLEQPGADGDAIETELVYWLYDHTADHEHRRLDCARTRSVLSALAEVPQFSRHAPFLRHAATRLAGADWTSQSREELIGLLSPRFDVVAEERAADYDSRLHPVLALRPR